MTYEREGIPKGGDDPLTASRMPAEQFDWRMIPFALAARVEETGLGSIATETRLSDYEFQREMLERLLWELERSRQRVEARLTWLVSDYIPFIEAGFDVHAPFPGNPWKEGSSFPDWPPAESPPASQ